MEYDESELLERAIQCKSFFKLVPPPPLAATYTITEVCHSEDELPVADKMAIFDIFAANMRDHYVSSGWKWDEAEKHKELFHRLSRFLLIKDESNKIVAYSMLRFTWDDDDEPEYPVLYVYELQVAKTHERKGLGKYLLSYMIALSRHLQMRKVLLTSLKRNTQAMQFYEHMGMKIDSYSPSKYGHNVEYEIMSIE